MKKIELFCPAKTNLFLAVTGRRADGFHDLLSLMVGLDFGDRLRLIFREEEGIELLCNASDLPRDSKNLAVRAAEVFRERFPFSGGLRIELEKNIPAGAG